MAQTWYVQDGDSDAVGPVTTEHLAEGVRTGRVSVTSRVCAVGAKEWVALATHEDFANVVRQVAPPPPTGPASGPEAPEELELELDPDDASHEDASEDSSSPAPEHFDAARQTWAKEFDRVLVAKVLHGRGELEQAVRSVLGGFRMAPSNFASSARLHLSWSWFPIVVAKGRFEGEWSGTAVPYKYVEKFDAHGHRQREKKRQAPQSFSGSMPSSTHTMLVSGDAQSVPQQLLPPGTQVGSLAADREVSQLHGGSFGPLPEPPTCQELRTSQADAANILSELAHRIATGAAESELRGLTGGDWEDRRVQVRLRADHQDFRLIIVPALVGHYSYRGKQWRAISFASNAHAGCEGAPTSAAKVAALVGLLAALIMGVLFWLDVGPVRSWFGVRSPSEATALNPESPSSGDVTQAPTTPKTATEAKTPSGDLLWMPCLGMSMLTAMSKPVGSEVSCGGFKLSVNQTSVALRGLPTHGLANMVQKYVALVLPKLPAPTSYLGRTCSKLTAEYQALCKGDDGCFQAARGTIESCAMTGGQREVRWVLPSGKVLSVVPMAGAQDGGFLGFSIDEDQDRPDQTASGWTPLSWPTKTAPSATPPEPGKAEQLPPATAPGKVEQARPCKLGDLADCTTQCAKHEAESCFNLAVMFANGKGVAKDERRAIPLYTQACDAGFAKGCYDLGSMYANGDGVTADATMANRLWTRSCQAGFNFGCIAAQAHGGVPTATTSAPPPDGTPFTQGQRWQGSYVCGQGRTPLELRILSVQGNMISDAIFAFTNGPVSGSYHVTGGYDPRTRSTTLVPGAWVVHPPDYIAVGMSGTVATSPPTFAGSITSSGCTNFKVQLVP